MYPLETWFIFCLINYMSFGANWLHVLRHAINLARNILLLSVFTVRHKFVNSHLHFPKIDKHYLISINTLILTLCSVASLINI